MNEREALEKIKEVLGEVSKFNVTDWEFRDKLDNAWYMATQALAPQECDKQSNVFRYQNTEGKNRIATFNIDNNTIRIGGKNMKALNFTAGWSGVEGVDLMLALYKQLHSQQKTFTVEEIKRILTEFCDKEPLYCEEYGEDIEDYTSRLIAEFEGV